MRRTLSIVLLALLLTAAGISIAGERQKCDLGAQECLDKMAAKLQEKAWMGVDLDKNDHGWYQVTSVVAGSPAESAGFQAGDVLLTVNGVKIHADNKEELKQVKQALAPGTAAEYIVKRSGGKQKVAVTLGHVPATVMAEWIGEHMLEHHTHTVIASK